jgi:hypothetical protein
MIIKNIQKNKAFVLLFAVTISAILLAIALGVANIAFREVKFGTSAVDTNNAFFAADVGAECALYYNRTPNPPYNFANAFQSSPDAMNCAGTTDIEVTKSSTEDIWTFVVSNLGSTGQGCAIVTVNKTVLDVDGVPTTSIISKGYNNGSNGDGPGTCKQGSNTVERQLEIN